MATPANAEISLGEARSFAVASRHPSDHPPREKRLTAETPQGAIQEAQRTQGRAGHMTDTMGKPQIRVDARS